MNDSKYININTIAELKGLKSKKYENADCLLPQYKITKQGEYNSILNDEMKNILLTLLLHPSRYNYGKAIRFTKELLRKRGYEELPCDLTFKRLQRILEKIIMRNGYSAEKV